MSYKLCILSGSFFAFSSVILGAFAAHFLKARLSPYALDIFETGCRYQMYHAFAFFVLAFCFEKQVNLSLQLSFFSFLFGIFLFSGSLYALAFSGVKVLGAITPLGGLCFLLGWAFLFVSIL